MAVWRCSWCRAQQGQWCLANELGADVTGVTDGIFGYASVGDWVRFRSQSLRDIRIGGGIDCPGRSAD